MKIRKGDNAIMLNGKDRGKSGRVILVIPEDDKVIVEGLNMIKRHTKPRQQGQSGQIISKERAVNSASVALVCKNCGKPTRIGYQITGKIKSRICKKCKTEV
jgi:large subunit ribosomal protein L24